MLSHKQVTQCYSPSSRFVGNQESRLCVLDRKPSIEISTPPIHSPLLSQAQHVMFDASLKYISKSQHINLILFSFNDRKEVAYILHHLRLNKKSVPTLSTASSVIKDHFQQLSKIQNCFCN